MAGLFDAGHVAEFTFSGVFGVFAAHAVSHEGFDFFREVLLNLFGEIAVDLPTGEKLSQPTHDGPLDSAGARTRWMPLSICSKLETSRSRCLMPAGVMR